MRERPILFSAPMVRAILEGRKTVTRRVVKLPPSPDHLGEWQPATICADMAANSTGRNIPLQGCIWHTRTGKSLLCPYGQPGDQLWVREAFALQSCVDGEDAPFNDGRPIKLRPDDDWEGVHAAWTQPHYRATDPAPDLCCENSNCAQCRDHDMGPHWRPSIHMPRWASRITLEVTNVRVERLHEIKDEESIDEGVDADLCRASIGKSPLKDGYLPLCAFAYLWDQINGAGSWAANPWVWVVEFRSVK